MKVIRCAQLSPEWWMHRLGRPTASNFDRIITPKTGKLSAQADDLMCELIADKIRGTPPPDSERWSNPAQRHGAATEPEARSFYEMDRNVQVEQVGLCVTDDGRFSCSPDGLVGDDGGLELKCPDPKTHVRYLVAGKLPDDYKPQVHGNLLITGRKWWDFLSYVPGMEPLVIRVEPDDYTQLLRVALDQFWERFVATRLKVAPEVWK